MKHIHPTGPFTRFLTGTGLPLFFLSSTLVYEGFLLAIVLAPDSTSAWGGFAREFKQWCFNYDPASGKVDGLQAAIMLVEPLFILGITLFLWKQPVKQLTGRISWLKEWRTLAAGAATAGAVILGLFAYGRPPADADAPLPFPGERIRTSLPAPDQRFNDHRGNAYRFADSRGKVTLVTGIYATCSTSCPLILLETKALLDSLPEGVLAHLEVAAISLSPEYDTDSLMNAIATQYGFHYPQFRYLNGEAGTLNHTTRGLGFSRTVDPETGMINHANLFLLIDAQGNIAYRFGLDKRHKPWLREAVLALVREIKPRELAADLR